MRRRLWVLRETELASSLPGDLERTHLVCEKLYTGEAAM